MKKIIEKNCELFKLDIDIVCGIIIQESQGDPWACRFEEKWHAARLLMRPRSRLAGYVPPVGKNPSLYDEKIWRAHSFGAMQVLGETARVLGFRGRYLPELLDPELSIQYGCKYLAKCLLRTDRDFDHNTKNHYRRALLGYNGGGDKLYPEKVFGRIERGEIKILLLQ